MRAAEARAARLVAALLVPGALFYLAWAERGSIVRAAGWVVRSAFAGNVGGFRSAPIDTIVLHTTESTAQSAIAWFGMDHTPSGGGPSSAHYVIASDGTVTQVVPDDRIAWHAGNREINGRSIGIECAGHAADPATWTPELVASLESLCATLAAQYSVPVERGIPGFVGHAEVPDPSHPGQFGGAGHHTDPGPFLPWDAVLARVRGAAMGVA